MADWQTNVHDGFRTRFLQYGNCTIEINRPILSEEEQKRREKQVMEALKCFGKDS